MPTGHQRPAERYRGEGVAGVAEGGEEEPVRGQSASTRSRIIRSRASASKAMGATMSVPTPASR